MKSKNIAIAAILAATLMGSAITVYSQPAPAGDMPEGMREMGGCQGEMPCPGMQGHGMHGMMGRGAYTPEQQQKYDAIVADFAKQMEPDIDRHHRHAQGREQLQVAVQLVRVEGLQLGDRDLHRRAIGAQWQRQVQVQPRQRIFERVGVPEVVSVKSDSGMMGGNISHEFMLLTPVGEDSIDVHLTIADQKVEKVEIVGHPFTTISKNHQNDFAEAINGVVDGKPLKDLKVDKVAGASWTSDAFNKALEVARQEASIQ